jgi:cysteine desulfurase
VTVNGAPRIAYLDHAASSPVRDEVVEAVAPFLAGYYGNPSGSHRLARQARQALEEARDEVAALLGCGPGEVVFTSGGTESVNLALFGALGARRAARRPGGVVVHSAVEHPAVLESCRAALARGDAEEVRVAPVDAHGTVDLDALVRLLGPEVSVVSVMAANNEVGTVEPLAEVGRLVRRLAPEAVLHSDAVQAAAALDLAEAAACADLVSVSSHKLGGPKGAGALVVRDGTALAPILHGGGQERERRSGTNDVAGAVGLAAALRACAAGRHDETGRRRALRDRLADALVGAVAGLTETVPRDLTLPGHLHVTIEGTDREELLVLLDHGGVCAAAGSSCASGALEPSHVLAAMGVDPARARGALRLTLGHTTTDDDVDRVIEVLPAAVARLRAADHARA